ncbi:hypothetical protein CI102_10638 [Trichoderma harzianum]|nr:hypothetical protein CI102_10638 [Trichoderma harzianum]
MQCSYVIQLITMYHQLSISFGFQDSMLCQSLQRGVNHLAPQRLREACASRPNMKGTFIYYYRYLPK